MSDPSSSSDSSHISTSTGTGTGTGLSLSTHSSNVRVLLRFRPLITPASNDGSSWDVVSPPTPIMSGPSASPRGSPRSSPRSSPRGSMIFSPPRPLWNGSGGRASDILSPTPATNNRRRSRQVVAESPNGRTSLSTAHHDTANRSPSPLSRHELGNDLNYLQFDRDGRSFTLNSGQWSSNSIGHSRKGGSNSAHPSTPTSSNPHASSTSSSSSGGTSRTYTFDRVFQPDADQQIVFESVAKQAVDDVLAGKNSTILAYGSVMLSRERSHMAISMAQLSHSFPVFWMLFGLPTIDLVKPVQVRYKASKG